ncbi:RNA polymerase sigma factor [Arsenicicoccus sp. oral taxon 190]|uniref:RNA polymerase sigma factor n=1 Tax=Arsenicicoccus sp. oral taxon 190 TaxID=1658671 RepID=UPI00067A19C1|nr:DUF6596 domain-containing protein [Arsenicicoccus sp. oral taxon 190]AKT50576.1 hypothetical protein ADJ73_03325 [Arsenicicoccus sp. oral taxon 190]
MDPVEAACREHWGRLLALLAVRCRDLDLAEDALADAVEAALRTWPKDGTPREPAAWLLTTARRRLIDQQRATATARRKVPLLVVEQIARERSIASPVEQAVLDADLPDERLRLLLLCCHPALSPEAQAALALRLVLGLPTSEVARLFLLPEPTMAARLTRAKRRVARSAIPLSLPDRDHLPARVEAAARTAYLCFTAAYAPGEGPDLLRADLAGEAVRLARLLVELVPTQQVPRALLALLLLQHARRDARVDGQGGLVLLVDQDRSQWRRAEIAEGMGLLAAVTPDASYALELTLQAQIAAVHDVAPTSEDTDWRTIVDRYQRLEALTGSPVVRLHRAVAVAESDGAAAGLALLDDLDDRLPRSHRVPAVRAELNARLGLTGRAVEAYDDALRLCRNDAERAYLRSRRDRLGCVSAPR